MNRSIVDKDLLESVTMPEADATVYSADIDLGLGDKVTDAELTITIPDMTTTHLPDADTLTVTVLNGAAASPTGELLSMQEVFTGAGGAGASGRTIRYAIPTSALQYLRVKIVAAGGTGDMSALSATVQLNF